MLVTDVGDEKGHRLCHIASPISTCHQNLRGPFDKLSGKSTSRIRYQQRNIDVRVVTGFSLKINFP